jgi:multisubunit Na+/H+ antiporter MnhC subunit
MSTLILSSGTYLLLEQNITRIITGYIARSKEALDTSIFFFIFSFKVGTLKSSEILINL